MEIINIQTTLKLVGYMIITFSEELDYINEYVKISEFDKKINEIKERAKNIDSQEEYAYVYFRKIYETDNELIGQTPNEEMIAVLDLDANKKYVIASDEEIKIELSENSKKYKKLKGKKIKSYRVDCCQYYFDETDLIYEIDGKYYLMSDDLYEIPKDLYSFVEQIIDKN